MQIRYFSLAQVETPLYSATRLILELAAGIQVIDEPPFRRDQLQLDLVEKIHMLFVFDVVDAAQFYLAQLFTTVRTETQTDFLGNLLLRRLAIETIDDESNGLPTGGEFRGSSLGALAPPGIGKPDFADDPGQRQPLTDECHQHDDEREQKHQIAMRKRSAGIGFQRESRAPPRAKRFHGCP